MYIYDNEGSGLQDASEGQSIILRPSERTSVFAPLGPYLGEPQQTPSPAAPPITLSMRPRPFLRLDKFAFSKFFLSKDLQDRIRSLATHIFNSWSTPQRILKVRLIGHTDEVGGDDYNFRLGMQRAESVKTELENDIDNFKKGLAKGPTRQITIEAESRGKKEPLTLERSKRELNRRVEVFLTVAPAPPAPPPPAPQPTPKKPAIDFTKLPEETKRRMEERDLERRFNRPVPGLPRGKSFKQWLDEKLKDHHVPKILRDKIWDAIFSKNFGLLSVLLDAAGFSGAEKNAVLESSRVFAESPTR